MHLLILFSVPIIIIIITSVNFDSNFVALKLILIVILLCLHCENKVCN